jgi:type IV pilus assembly protein PilA
MFQKFHALREEREGGFTLIELLVVILIIAILAAIAIPVFLKQREKGWISQMESALKNATTAAESFATGPGDGNYNDAGGPLDQTKLETEGWKKATDVTPVAVNIDATGNKYCVQVSHAKYAGTSEPMAISSDHTTPDPGTCVAGVWTAP